MVLMLHLLPLGYPSQQRSLSHGAVSSRGRRARGDGRGCAHVRAEKSQSKELREGNGKKVCACVCGGMQISGCK